MRGIGDRQVERPPVAGPVRGSVYEEVVETSVCRRGDGSKLSGVERAEAAIEEAQGGARR